MPYENILTAKFSQITVHAWVIDEDLESEREVGKIGSHWIHGMHGSIIAETIQREPLCAETIQREPLCAAGFNAHFSAFTELLHVCM